MARPLHLQSVRRKLLYFALILVLFTATLVVRHADFSLGRWQVRGVEAQANELALRELNQGEVELTGAAVRLSLTGSRGLAVCGLWYMADEKKKRGEWNQMELLVDSITKLQPHFITPWLFQGWNLAYNVSVESDRVRDKFFYISRGIQLLAEGERQNRDNPDIRFNLGYTYQDKFGVSDEANSLRSYYQLSCMDPADRDPRRLRKPDGSVDLEQFTEFCRKHPQLVRRLREPPLELTKPFRCTTPGEVVDFLTENPGDPWEKLRPLKIPTRYEDPEPAPATGPSVVTRLRPPEDQFPTLPPRFEWEGATKTPLEHVGDDFDNYQAARAWLSYAQEPLPPPVAKPNAGLIDYDKHKYRAPRGMMSLLFRQFPCMAQTRSAERLEREGWFDEIGAREMPVSFFDDETRTRYAITRVLGDPPRNWAGDAWRRAHEMWLDHGERNGLYLTDAELSNLMERSKRLRAGADQEPEEIRAETDQEQAEALEASQQLAWYERNRTLTNFPHFLDDSDAQKTADAVRGQRLFYQAAYSYHKQADLPRAVRLYEEAFPVWLRVFNDHPRFAENSEAQELVYKNQLEYLKLVQDLRGSDVKSLLVLQDCLGQAALRPPGMPLWLPSANLLRPSALPPPVKGPFDGRISTSVAYRVHTDRGLPVPDWARPRMPDVMSPSMMRGMQMMRGMPPDARGSQPRGGQGSQPPGAPPGEPPPQPGPP
jgi:hypothetical protein